MCYLFHLVRIVKPQLKTCRCSSAFRSDEHAGRQSWERQLELAVAWNRVDIAESEIFTEESQWTVG